MSFICIENIKAFISLILNNSFIGEKTDDISFGKVSLLAVFREGSLLLNYILYCIHERSLNPPTGTLRHHQQIEAYLIQMDSSTLCIMLWSAIHRCCSRSPLLPFSPHSLTPLLPPFLPIDVIMATNWWSHWVCWWHEGEWGHKLSTTQ